MLKWRSLAYEQGPGYDPGDMSIGTKDAATDPSGIWAIGRGLDITEKGP